MAQGQSSYTQQKEGVFGLYFGWMFSRFKDEKSPFNVIDLNCGSGYNQKVNTVGTPLLMCRSAEKHKANVRAIFVDKSKKQIETLKKQPEFSQLSFWDTRNYCFVCQDNAIFLQHIEALGIARSARGVFISDPNGCKAPIEQIRKRSAEYARFDTIFHFSGANRVRAFYQRDKENRKAWARDTVLTARRVVSTIPRYRWMISLSYCRGQEHYVLIGTNLSRRNLPDCPRLNLYDIEKPEGHEMLQKASGVR